MANQTIETTVSVAPLPAHVVPSVVQHLSILDDLMGLLYGKGGAGKIAPAIDIVAQIAGLVAALVPPAAPIAGIVALGAAALSQSASQPSSPAGDAA